MPRAQWKTTREKDNELKILKTEIIIMRNIISRENH